MADDNSTATPALTLLSTKRLPQPINFPFTAYSHAHDLLAIVTSQSEVQVFRIISGQVAFTISRSARDDTDLHITALQWKTDGTCLGIGWSDAKFGIYDGGNGRQMSLEDVGGDGAEEEFMLSLSLGKGASGREEAGGEVVRRIGCLGFVRHFVDSGTERGKVGEEAGPLTTEEWYDGIEADGPDDDEGFAMASSKPENSIADLPRAIAALDVTSVLPRLSAIQAHGFPFPKSGPGASKFGSQAATDSQFETQRASNPGVLQSLLVCLDDCTAQVLLDETVKIGMRSIAGRPMMHAGHSRSSKHAILCEGEDQDGPLRLTFLDLPLPILDGPLLHVITTNTKRIQTLLDYVVQTIRCVQHDYTSNVLIPMKFLNLLAEDLQSKEKDSLDVVTSFYHLAMTGNFTDNVLLEWISDFLKDANIKRWEQHLNNLYTSTRSHLFINLLPALDRFSIALTTLRGQAAFQEGSSHFDCKPQLFTTLLENIDSIRLVAQKMLLIVQTEHRQFQAFIRWLKMQIEITVAEPFSRTALETEERESASIDYPLVLSYIKTTMMQSKLALHVQNRPAAEEKGTCDAEQFFQKPYIRDMSYEGTKEALRQLDNGQNPLKLKDVEDPESLLNLPSLTCGLMGRVSILLKRITEWQKSVVFSPIDPSSIELDLPMGCNILDMKMAPSTTSQGCATSILALDPDAPNELLLLLTITPLRTSSLTSPRWNSQLPTQNLCRLPFDADILDAKLLPHTAQPTLLLLLRQHDETSTIQLVKFHLQTERADALHSFTDDSGFKPERFLCGGRKGKLLLVVFGRGGREWRVLDLESGVSRGMFKGKGVIWAEGVDDEEEGQGMDVA